MRHADTAVANHPTSPVLVLFLFSLPRQTLLAAGKMKFWRMQGRTPYRDRHCMNARVKDKLPPSLPSGSLPKQHCHHASSLLKGLFSTPFVEELLHLVMIWLGYRYKGGKKTNGVPSPPEVSETLYSHYRKKGARTTINSVKGQYMRASVLCTQVVVTCK